MKEKDLFKNKLVTLIVGDKVWQCSRRMAMAIVELRKQALFNAGKARRTVVIAVERREKDEIIMVNGIEFNTMEEANEYANKNKARNWLTYFN